MPQPDGGRPLLEQVGIHQPGKRRWRHEPAVRGGPGGSHQLVHPCLVVRHQSQLPHGVFPSGKPHRSNRCSRDVVWWTSVRTCSKFLRWGLWMSPIINSFLRPMEEPTRTTRTACIHTVVATSTVQPPVRRLFASGTRNVFICLLAYDAVRLLIWLDHMGLRIATLVNLSFLGMDRLDERLARFFLGLGRHGQVHPGRRQAVCHLGTVVDSLLPSHGPGLGLRLDSVGSRAVIRRRRRPLAAISASGFVGRVVVPAGAMLACTAVFSLVCWRRGSFGGPARLEPEQCEIHPDTRQRRRACRPGHRQGLHHQPSLLTISSIRPEERLLEDTARHATNPARARPLIGSCDSVLLSIPREVEFREDALVILRRCRRPLRTSS